MKNKPILLIILITMICSLNPSTRVTAQSSNAKVVVRRSNGNAFTANEDWTQGAYFGSRGTFFVDVTGDGKADAIAVNDDTVTVRRSDGNAFTANEDWTLGAYYGSRGTFFADVTGDGKADAIVVNDDTVTVRRSDGLWFLPNEDWTQGAYFGSRGTFFADVTGDGKADAIVVNDDTVTVRRSDGFRFLPNEDWTLGAYYGSRGTFFADVTGDGKADAIVVNDDTVTVRRSGGGGFTANGDWTQGAYYGSEGSFYADVTGDGKADAIVVNTNVAELYVDVDIAHTISGELPPKPSSTELRIQPDGSIVGMSKGPLASVPSLMWNPGQTLRVRMSGGSALVRSKVRKYAEEWTSYANIRFAFVDDSQPAEIRVSFDKGGSWSHVGRTALLVPFNFSTINFGWLDDNLAEVEFRSVVLHEFGHALGLIHEHQSPASDIQWDKEKAYRWYKEKQGWDKDTVDLNVFGKYNETSTNYSQFDQDSIMVYPIPSELTLDGQGTPWTHELSAVDKEYIRRWYPYPGDARGQLRTGDDCDEIEFVVEHGVVSPDSVTFLLRSGVNVTWWKSISVPVGSGYSEIQIEHGASSEVSIRTTDKDNSRPLRFSKAKFLGAHTMLDYTWDVLPALPGGTRLTLTWTKDRCN